MVGDVVGGVVGSVVGGVVGGVVGEVVGGVVGGGDLDDLSVRKTPVPQCAPRKLLFGAGGRRDTHSELYAVAVLFTTGLEGERSHRVRLCLTAHGSTSHCIRAIILIKSVILFILLNLVSGWDGIVCCWCLWM